MRKQPVFFVETKKESQTQIMSATNAIAIRNLDLKCKKNNPQTKTEVAAAANRAAACGRHIGSSAAAGGRH